MTALWVTWAVLSLAGFAVLEAVALRDRRPGTTLSAQVWRLRMRWPARLLGGAACGWLLWHLASPWDTATGGADDVVAVAVGAALGVLAAYKTTRQGS